MKVNVVYAAILALMLAVPLAAQQPAGQEAQPQSTQSIAGEQDPAQEGSATQQQQRQQQQEGLPATASPLAWYLVGGLGSLAGALGIRLSRRGKS